MTCAQSQMREVCAHVAIVDDRLSIMSANYTYDDGKPGRFGIGHALRSSTSIVVD